MDGGVGRQSTVEVEGARDQSYPLTIGMEGATERRPKLWKGTSVGSRKVCFFVGKWSEGNGFEIKGTWKLQQLKYVGTWWWSHTLRGGKIPLDRCGATTCRNRDWNVCFMSLSAEGEVTTSWGGLVGWRALARYWEQIRERWSWTGSISFSSCKWSIEAILTQPVAMRRAEFCIVWSFWTRDG